MTSFPVVRFLQSPFGRLMGRALHRFAPTRRLTSRLVWWELARDPEFVAGMRAGQADADAGRMYHWNGALPAVPAASWKADDPSQPHGWHHDGESWVSDDPIPDKGPA